MNPAARQAEIANIIRQRVRVSVNELAELLNFSRETIRRDLADLAQAGKIQKFHGGASLPLIGGEGPFRDRLAKNVAAKTQIAAEALKLISPGQTILIDTGSTTLYFAEKAVEIPDLTVVTNSTSIARIMSTFPSRAKTFLLGGEFNSHNRQTFGSMAVSQLQSFRAHHAILTIGALDSRTGAMDFNVEEALLARAMIQQAEALTILVDSSKFGQIASFEVCGLNRITNLVCEQRPPDAINTALLEAGVNIVCASTTSPRQI